MHHGILQRLPPGSNDLSIVSARRTRLPPRRPHQSRANCRIKGERACPCTYLARVPKRSRRAKGRCRRLANSERGSDFAYRPSTLRRIQHRRLRPSCQRRRRRGPGSFNQLASRFFIKDGSECNRTKGRRSRRRAHDYCGNNSMGNGLRRANRPKVRPNTRVVSNCKLRPLIRPRRGRRGRRGGAVSGAGHASDGVSTVFFRPLIGRSCSGAQHGIRRREDRASNRQIRCSFPFRPRGTPVGVRRLFLVTR